MAENEQTGDPTKESKKSKPKWTKAGKLRFTLFVIFMFWVSGPILLQTSFYPSVVLWPTPLSDAQLKNLDHDIPGKREEYFFENANHEKLHGFLWRVDGAKKVVLYHHGNAGNIATRGSAYAALRDCKANVFAYDCAGFGKSQGAPSLQGVMDDGMAAYKFVAGPLKFSPQDIVNYGESLGSGPACYVAVREPSAGLILQSAIPSLPKAAKGAVFILHMYPDFLFQEPHMDNVRMIENVHVPVAIIHGGKDVLSPDLVKEIYDHAHEPKYFVVLKDSHHMSVESRADIEAFMQALNRILSPSESVPTKAEKN